MYRIKFYQSEQQSGKQQKALNIQSIWSVRFVCFFVYFYFLIFSQKELRRNLQIRG